MKYLKVGAFFAVAFIIQPSLLNLVSIGGHTPNLLFCLVVVFSYLFENEIYGVVFGAFFGLLYDICFGAVLGPTAIALVAAAILVLVLREFTNIENILNMWMVSFVSVVVFNLTYWGLLRIGGNPVGIVTAAESMIWTGLYSFAVITLIYSVLIRKIVRHRKDRYFR